jgi:hypothetical protein
MKVFNDVFKDINDIEFFKTSSGFLDVEDNDIE